MSKEERLKVLDMNEDEQVDWLWDRNILKPNESLADLAFRLRDEAVKKDWMYWEIACCQVWQATPHKYNYNPGRFGSRAKPIHWIIAALIAKEKS
jgi:hypothetical protein